MKNKQTKKTLTEDETPIIDGDARPDKQGGDVGSNTSTSTSPLANKKDKNLTKARASDLNSLEDFKDER